MSSPPKAALRSRGSRTDWIHLYRSERLRGHSWVVNISKKVVSTSVRRSMLKRLIREAMRRVGALPDPETTWRFVVKSDPPNNIRMAEVELKIRRLTGRLDDKKVI